MAKYSYKACNDAGQIIEGLLEAESQSAAEKVIREEGNTPLKVKIKRSFLDSLSPSIQLALSGVKTEDIIVFTRQLRTLLMAGVPILRALEVTSEQTEVKELKETIRLIRHDVEGGEELSSALSKYPQFFPEIYIGSVKAGEKGGVLTETLDHIANYLEYEMGIKRDIISALRYPLIVIIGLFLAGGVFTVFVLPKFAKIFSSFKIDLPWPTRVVIELSNFMRTHLVLVGLAMVFIFMMFRIWKGTNKGSLQWDAFKLRIPIFGKLFQKLVLLRWTKMLQMMYESGLPLLKALSIVSRTLNNRQYEKEMQNAVERVEAGESLSSYLKDSYYFPPMVVHMVATGEQTGNLDKMLAELSQHFDMELRYRIRNLTVMIEPVITIILGVGVLIFALAVFLPMWDLVKIAKH